jgi:hypothetical protein
MKLIAKETFYVVEKALAGVRGGAPLSAKRTECMGQDFVGHRAATRLGGSRSEDDDRPSHRAIVASTQRAAYEEIQGALKTVRKKPDV